ncbi:hypothetical protein QFZ54_001502 [Sphingomonas faeni]|nr:hypothetical protein [Sphingomonas faeni]
MKGNAFEAEAGNTSFGGLPVQGRVLRLWEGGREVRLGHPHNQHGTTPAEAGAQLARPE